MAFSTQRSVSDGTLRVLMLTVEFFDKSEITAYFNNIPTTAFVWATDKSLRFNANVPAGVEVLVRRTTDLSQPRHIFTQGAQFKDSTLDEDFKQILHIAQEAVEGANVGDIYQTLNMHGNIIANVGNAVADGDAMNLGQVKAWSQSALNQADRATTEANRAQTQANSATASAGAAASSATTATGARDTALTYRNDSQTARDLAREWAVRAVDSQIPGYAGSYSAMHYAVKAAASAVTAKNEADRAVPLAASAEASANRSSSEADRAKTEADKLGNFNGLAGALDSVVGVDVTWKGVQVAKGRYQVRNDGDATYEFANVDGTNNIRWTRNAGGLMLLVDDKRGVVRMTSGTNGTLDIPGNFTTAGNLRANGGVIGVRALLDTSTAGLWFYGTGDVPRATIFATKAGSLVLYPAYGGGGQPVTLAPTGQLNTLMGIALDGPANSKLTNTGELISTLYPGSSVAKALAFYDSGFFTVAGSRQYDFTHGLWQEPVRYAIQIKCVTPENGYAVGDIINCPVGLDFAGGGLAYGFDIRQYNATTFNLFVGQSLRAYAINKGNTAVAGPTPANWQVRVIAYAV